VSWSARFLLVTLLLTVVDLANGEGAYQRTRNGKVLVWNDHPNAGDEATWSGGRDRDGYARGFGQLTWFTKEKGFDKPQLYARYWGRMVDGKLDGPVNVHSQKKTHHAIFANGARVTHWTRGRSPSRMTPQQIALVAKHNAAAAAQEPESPAAGPEQRLEETMSIQDLWSERWPKIDIDDSLRLLALPPRSLRK
jgi:hypothetical protein